jgi:peptide/nickel transport system substrate-binding protein
VQPGQTTRISLIIAVVACVILGVFGCGKNEDEGAAAEEIVFGMGSIPSTGNPFAFLAPPNLFLYHAVFDGLTQLDSDQKVVPALAESWERRSETEWVFTLRKGVKFQDDEALDAEAVKFTFDHLLDNPEEPASRQVATVKDVSVLDQRRVRIETKEPDPLLLKRLSAVFIVAPDAFRSGKESFATKPVGTGNFRVAQFAEGRQVTLEAWDESWQDPPRIKTVTFRQIPDPATRLQALRSGQIDVAQGVSPDDIDSLESAGFTVKVVPRAQVQQATFETTSTSGPWEDTRVRQAMNYAVDKEAIVRDVLGGTAKLANGQIVGSDAFGYSPDVKGYPYDPKKAKELLKQAGYGDGFEITMQATVGNFPNDKQAYEAVVGYLQDVGIRARLEIVSLSEWLDLFYAGPRKPLFVQGLQYFPELDSAKALNYYRCDQPEAQRHFCNDKLDALLDEADSEFNQDARRESLQQANALFREEAPVIFLWQLGDTWGMREGVNGWVARPDAVLPLSTLRVES